MSTSTEDLKNVAVSAKSLEDIKALSTGTVSVRVSGLDDAKAGALTRVVGLRCIIGGGDTKITDAGLGLLSKLGNLTVLDLETCATITNAGLLKLGTLKQLRWLDLSFCDGITTEGVDQLRALLPDCKIELATD
jgi:F-box/leucine-rich repeat protein 14